MPTNCKTMRKSIISAFMAFLSFAAAQQASAASYTLAVTTTDGQPQRIELNEYPVITMTGGRLEIKSEATTLSFDLQSVADFKYLDADASIGSIGQPQEVTRDGDNLIFKADAKPLSVLVSDISGLVVYSTTIAAGEESAFSLSQLAEGIYVVSVNNVSFKIIK